jgi:hypothetical protein
MDQLADWYTVSIALPGSIMNNILKENLAAYVCGEVKF